MAEEPSTETKAKYEGKLVVLWTSYVSNQVQLVAWRKLETSLDGMHLKIEKIDGAAPENRDVRSALWGISGKRGYPQVFMEGQFIGDMEEGDNNIQDMMDRGEFKKAVEKYIDWDVVTPRPDAQ